MFDENRHGASARVKFRSVAADVRRVVFFAKDSQHRSQNVPRNVFFARDGAGSHRLVVCSRM